MIYHLRVVQDAESLRLGRLGKGLGRASRALHKSTHFRVGTLGTIF